MPKRIHMYKLTNKNLLERRVVSPKNVTNDHTCDALREGSFFFISSLVLLLLKEQYYSIYKLQSSDSLRLHLWVEQR